MALMVTMKEITKVQMIAGKALIETVTGIKENQLIFQMVTMLLMTEGETMEGHLKIYLKKMVKVHRMV